MRTIVARSACPSQKYKIADRLEPLLDVEISFRVAFHVAGAGITLSKVSIT